MIRFPMTKNCFDKLEHELEYLKSTKRKEITNAIVEARAFGDLKENAEYHTAREQQSLLESKIQMLEYKLSKAQVIEINKINNTGRVIFGSTVDLEYNNCIVRYKIVSEEEANINNNTISFTSPLGKGIIGRKEGEIYILLTPNGNEVKYKILKVLHI